METSKQAADKGNSAETPRQEKDNKQFSTYLELGG